jgi:hypothetical protein
MGNAKSNMLHLAIWTDMRNELMTKDTTIQEPQKEALTIIRLYLLKRERVFVYVRDYIRGLMHSTIFLPCDDHISLLLSFVFINIRRSLWDLPTTTLKYTQRFAASHFSDANILYNTQVKDATMPCCS